MACCNPFRIMVCFALVFVTTTMLSGCGGSDSAGQDTVNDVSQSDSGNDTAVDVSQSDSGNDIAVDSKQSDPGSKDAGPDAGKDVPLPDSGKDIATDPGDATAQPLVVQIGPEKQDVDLPNGGVLRIPWGALDGAVTVSITPMPSPVTGLFEAAGPFYKFEPSGLAFNKPATLEATYSEDGIPSPVDGRFVVAWREDGGEWQAMHTTVDAAKGVVKAYVHGFSEGGPGYWGEEPPPCNGPGDCADPEPDDCWKADCQDGHCAEVVEEAETPCNTHSLCFFNGGCDADGECVGIPKPCNQPPGPKDCYKDHCNPATGLCEYPLDGECGQDGDCPGEQSCINCKCSNCTTAQDCGVDDLLPCDSSVDCIDGKCVSVIKPAGTPCDNGDQCDVDDECDAFGLCVGSEKQCNTPPGPTECYEPGECWNDETGECDYQPKGECGVDAECLDDQRCESCKCVDNCCEKDGMYEVLSPTGCSSEGGKLVDGALCEEVCCQNGDEVALMTSGACKDDGGTAIGEASCNEVCCGEASGAYAVMTEAECAAMSGTVSADSSCVDVCCSDGAKIVIVPEGECLDSGGWVIVWSECEICCETPSGIISSMTEKECLDGNGTIKTDVSYCPSKCGDDVCKVDFGETDENCPEDCVPCWDDEDKDGHGAGKKMSCNKNIPVGFVSDDTDCDDSNAEIWQMMQCYTDEDDDGCFGSEAAEYCAGETCESIEAQATAGNDCDDADFRLCGFCGPEIVLGACGVYANITEFCQSNGLSGHFVMKGIGVYQKLPIDYTMCNDGFAGKKFNAYDLPIAPLTGASWGECGSCGPCDCLYYSGCQADAATYCGAIFQCTE